MKKLDNIVKFLRATIPGKINQSYWICALIKLGDITEAEAGYIFNQL
jgi:hypothetical protein